MEYFDQEKYDRAKKRMEEIKGFYSHLAIYIVINILLLLAQTGFFTNNWLHVETPSWSYFTTPFFWGIGVLGHGLYVFQHKFTFLKGWEDRKIKEYMEKEEREISRKK